MPLSRVLATVAAVGSGAILASVALASHQAVHAASATTVHTCAAADGELRVTEANVPCAPEERRVRLRLPAPADPECTADNSRLEKLSRRVRDLESQDRRGTLRGRRVVAPFTVIQKSGQRLVRIEEQNVTFYNRDEKPVAWIVADNSGGLLQVQTAAGDREASIGVQGRLARVLLEENDKARIDVGRRANGRYGLQVFSQDKLVAYVGQSEAGSGLVHINDVSGATKAAMFVSSPSGVGVVDVRNASGTSVGLVSGSERAGLLQLSDGTGTVMVEAGVNPNGAGVVRTGPNMRGAGVGLVGLVPSFILGKP